MSYHYRYLDQEDEPLRTCPKCGADLGEAESVRIEIVMAGACHDFCTCLAPTAICSSIGLWPTATTARRNAAIVASPLPSTKMWRANHEDNFPGAWKKSPSQG